MVKYKAIAEKIRENIKDGAYEDNRLPDQMTLAEEFGVSRVTIKKALDLLTTAGLVYSIQGSGTYVKQNALHSVKSSIQIGQNVGLTTAANESLDLSSKVLDFSVRFPSKEETELLMIPTESPVYEINRLRILEDRPYSIEHTVIPVHLVPNITVDVLERSLYQYIREEAGLVFGDNRQTIRAAQPNETDQKYLNCKETEPVLEVEKVMFQENGVPFEYSIVHHRFDMVEMSFVNTTK